MTAGEQAVLGAFALEDLARVARHLRAIDAAAWPARRARRRPSARPSGVEGHHGHVWWVAGPDVEAVALGLAAKATRPDQHTCATGSAHRPLPSPTAHGPVRLAVVDPDERKLRLARMVVATGEPWRGGDDVWFVPDGLLHPARGDGAVTGAAGDEGGGKVAFLVSPAAAPAGPAAFELLALARWMGVEAAGPGLVDAALRWLGAAPHLVATLAAEHTDRDEGVAELARRLHARGARVFVELGRSGRGALAPALARALGGRHHVAVTALAHGAGPLARLDRALAALWAEGAPVLPDALHRPPPAGPGPAVGPHLAAGPVPTSVQTATYQGEA
jgi:hypothetical protein